MDRYIFFVMLDVLSKYEAEFNSVYDTDHAPHMLQVPGARDCTRYRLIWSDNPDLIRYLAIYNISAPEIPRSEAWKKQSTLGRWPKDIRQHVTARSNGAYREILNVKSPASTRDLGGDAPNSEYIYFLQQSVRPEIEPAFNDLYGNDHIPLMLQTPGVTACTRYKSEYSDTGDVPDYLAIYTIDDAELPRSPEWKVQASLGNWTLIRPHFTARRNGVFQRIGFIQSK
jgi:hypothetical protein